MTTILIIDDRDDRRPALRAFLDQEGYTVVEAADEVSAVLVAKLEAKISELEASNRALRASEERFRQVSSAITDIAYSCSARRGGDFQIDWISGAVEAITGYTPAEVLAEGCWGALVVADDLPVFRERVTGLTPGASDVCELRLRRKNGEIVWVMSSAKCLADEQDAQIEHLYGSLVDITHRKATEDALRASEATLHRSQQVAQIGHWIWNTRTNQLIWSDEMYRIFGVDRTTFTGDLDAVVRMAIHPDDVERVERANQDVIEAAHPASMEYRVVWPDGSVHHVWAVPSDSRRDEHGQIVELSGIVQEITARKLAEERLRLQGAALEAAANGIVITNIDGAIEWVNPAFAALTGYSLAEVIGRNPRELVRSGAHVTDFYRTMWDTILAGQVWQGELVNRRKDGTTYFEEQTITPVRDAEGNIRHFIGIKQDITGRKAAEAALRRSEANLARAQGIAQLGSWDWDLVTGASEWSAQMHAFFGSDPAQAAPAPDEFRSLLHPDDAAVIDGICHAVAAGADVREVELRSHPERGPVRVFSGRVEGDRDATGRTVKLIGTLLDITARKQIEAEREQLLYQVRAQADQMQQIMDSVPEGVMLLDADCCVRTANPHAVAQLQFLANASIGVTLTELAGKPLAELLSAPPPGQWHIIEAGAQTFEVIARPVETGPQPGGWVLVIRDITQQRVVERQMQRQERMVAIGQLAAGIAHDFNNLMSVITLYAQMLAKIPGLDTRAQTRLTIIEQQALRATEMIRQILDFSRRTVVDRHLLDLQALLDQQVELLRRTLPEHIELEFAPSPGDYFVNGDPTRLQQAVMNLVFNARDAMPDGGQLLIALDRITVHSAHDAPLPGMTAGAWVRLAVRDSGVGMPVEVMNHIFEPFFTTKEPGQGTGLGLAQVYGIVGQHDGHITVSSRPDHGATFTIYLPAQQRAASEASGAAAGAPLPAGQGETILIVEDDTALRATVVELLESWGYRVRQAANGAEALTLLVEARESVDLVLSDAVMPKMGGVALFKELRARSLAQPVILMSGHPLTHDVDELRGMGLFAWITKPPEAEHLAQTIAAALRA